MTVSCFSISAYIHLNRQTSLQAGDTLRYDFTNYATQFGIDIHWYRGDNHIFNSELFLNDDK